MKNKLYICEHNVVVNPKNQCIECNYEELREELIKGGIIVDDNKQKIEQHFLGQRPKFISDSLIETLTKQNNEITSVNKKLCEDNRQLKNKISELEYIISNCKKENKGMKLNNERICSLIRDKNKTIDDVKTEIEEIHNIKDENNRQLEIEIDGLKNEIKNHEIENDELLLKNKELEEQNNCFSLTIDSMSKNYNNLNGFYVKLARENEIMKRDYTKLLHNITASVNKFNKLESKYNKLLDENRRIKHLKVHNYNLWVQLNDKQSRIDELIAFNKELSNELEQSKKLSTTKLFISLGVTILTIYLIIRFALFLS